MRWAMRAVVRRVGVEGMSTRRERDEMRLEWHALMSGGDRLRVLRRSQRKKRKRMLILSKDRPARLCIARRLSSRIPRDDHSPALRPQAKAKKSCYLQIPLQRDHNPLRQTRTGPHLVEHSRTHHGEDGAKHRLTSKRCLPPHSPRRASNPEFHLHASPHFVPEHLRRSAACSVEQG